MGKPNKINGFERAVIWMPTVEHVAAKETAASIKTSKSKFMRSGIRREVERVRKLTKTTT
jgi:hypothetical protein